MLENRLRDKLRSGETALGLMNTYPASGIIEGMCKGWDFVWVDGQHGQHYYESILHACQAADRIGVDVLLRVPSGDSSLLGNYADLAPSALMIPMVNTVDQAERIVQVTHFPPLGNRSYGGRRIIDLVGRDYYKDPCLLIVAQIETMEGLKNAADIIMVDGIDALFIGTDDLKVQMGLPISVDVLAHERLVDAMERTAEAAKGAEKHCGCVCGNEKHLERVVDMGYQIIVAGADIGFLRNESAQRLSTFRKIVVKDDQK
jgi:2-keto-3-deoxy-L-rhamnonate aldolase RhmA